ncbi:NADase-type glycan-binding domain-containing protein [Hyalangium gracile]|uniref:NADase-type glycan-binding domain-containing protein n=1 Tax=Hyalangium gracile TaxID=394092 RepID=UPI001CCD5BCA|nr:hypothetical protein [Hyalangium gracile]
MRPLLSALALLSSPLALAAEPATPSKPVVLEVEFKGGSAPAGSHPLAATDMKVSASSQLCEGKGKKRVCHGAERLVDRDGATAWCEGAAKDGTGESVTFEFPSPQELVAVDVVPYYAKDMRRAMGNARPKAVALYVDAQRYELTFPDHPARVFEENRSEPPDTSEGPCGDETCTTQDERINWAEHYRVKLPAPAKVQKVRLELLSTYEGDDHPDTCMSSVTFHVR